MMTVSHVRRVVVLAAVCVPAIAVGAERPGSLDAAPVVVAQSGPVRLVPRERVVPKLSPGETEQTEPTSPSDIASPAQTPHRSIQNIEVNTLRGPAPDEAGTLYADNGGFGSAVWEGMPRDLIGRLVQRLPAATQSPAMRDIVRRLLLTAAALPQREAGDGTSLIESRVERLQAMGFLGSAAELMDIASNRDSDERLQRLRAEIFLLRQDIGGACGEAARQLQQRGELFWQKLLVYCQAVQGDSAGASLGANLLAETGQVDDPVFFALADQLISGNPAKVDRLGNPSPLLLSMMRTANVPVPADALEQVSPPLMGMIGGSPNTPIEIRLEAAERAALYGAMTADRLAEVYASVKFSNEDLNNALSIADVTRTPRGRALLYQAALVHSVPTARAAVVQKGLALAREDGRYVLAAHAYETLLTGLAPSGELIWFAADASRALYALGRADLAHRWLVVLRQEAARDPEAAVAAAALWAVATLAESDQESATTHRDDAPPTQTAKVADSPLLQARGAPVIENAQQGAFGLPAQTAPETMAPASVAPFVGEPAEIPFDTAGAAAWRDALRTLDPEFAARRIVDAYTLLSAAGINVDVAEWRAMLGDTGPRMTVSPDPAYRKMLAQASAQGRRGETILMAALMLGETSSAAELDMTALAEIVSALRQVGLSSEARGLAIEIALQAGL